MERKVRYLNRKNPQVQVNCWNFDNRLMIELCGEFDKNLAKIEQQLDVQNHPTGNQLIFLARMRPQAKRMAF